MKNNKLPDDFYTQDIDIVPHSVHWRQNIHNKALNNRIFYNYNLYDAHSVIHFWLKLIQKVALMYE
jgi:hypothetical protein